ncbi:flavin monoamine oxidase family protein [Sphingomonas sp. SRS2]|uniref:flavin monoamine oxidase family protein n=1 Tax=Sphingomonas sp. SRS2 TaxID=133190 RepID=UPI0006184CE1|nr:NAD(P)/FAD-dependent oxidoreductase [Sphingomonas sp. SRS2]KKC25489.1 hypothetical protein WP12_13515 [Sphingomonas sp. SRS2]
MADWDIVVIGAGAAGIGAARTLAGRGLSVLMVEARDRIGGRAQTVRLGDAAVDMGCGYLHSAERNAWAEIGAGLGFTIDQSDPGWRTQYRNLGFPAVDRHEAGEAFARFSGRLRDNPPPSDRAADALDPDCRWNAYIEALSAYINGAALADVSVRDYLAYDDAASERNWGVREGYGALIASALPRRVELRLDTAVTLIDHSGPVLRLETVAGTIRTDRAIVTIPTPVLAAGRLAFNPPLAAKRDAAAALPLGIADKLFLAVANPGDIPCDAHLLGNPRSAHTGSYQLQPMGHPVVEGFFGGAAARELERLGPEGAAAFAIEELAGLLGNSVRHGLRPCGGSAWGRAAWIEGGYSHALPGEAGQRAILAAPVDDRIFFAGEACSLQDFSTAHGAHDTGRAAALLAIGKPDAGNALPARVF